MTAKYYKILKKLYWADKLNMKVTSEKIYKMCDRTLDQALPYPFNQHVEEEVRYEDGDANRTGFISINDTGIEYVEERKRRFWGFALPYSITTLIALLSLITTLIQICRG